MQNRYRRTIVVLSALFAVAVVLPSPANFAKELITQPHESERSLRNGPGTSSLGERILITTGGKLVLIDRATKAILWESSGLHGAYCVAALPGGGFLVGEGKSIAKVDDEGKVVSRVSANFKLTTDVKPLENGRILVSDGPAHTVAEMDWSGNITWSVSGLHHPSEATRLENGNTLVADGTAELKEFDSDGKKVRGRLLKQWAGAVQKVYGGYTLVGESGSVELLDIDGHPVWSHSISSRVTGVQQLPSGEYLICEPDAKRIAILDVSGNITWEATGFNYPWRAIYVQ